MLTIAMAVLAAQGAAAPARPVPRNRADWITAQDYPTGALQAKDQGTVAVRITVGKSGLPTGCIVERSSGSDILDSATCALLLRRARFEPGVGGSYASNIRWQLPADAVAPSPARIAAPAAAVAPGGGPGGRALGRAFVQCSRSTTRGPLTTSYSARLDVVGGRFVVNHSSIAQDNAGKNFVVRGGSSGTYAVLLPSSRALSAGVTEATNFGQRRGLDVTQSSAGKGPFTDGYVTTGFTGAIRIPGLVRGDKSVTFRILRDGRTVYEDADLALNDVDAPVVYVRTSFYKGEERTWLTGRITAQVLRRGKVMASYDFDVGLLDAEAVRLRIEPEVVGAAYHPGRLPAGCRVEPITD